MQNDDQSSKICHVCGSDKFVDEHHYDCIEGRISNETVPLCRRCHRTYHDLGIDWFEDEFLGKAIEIENKRRVLIYDSLKNPVKPLELATRSDIQRSSYWYKVHPESVLAKPKRVIESSQLEMQLWNEAVADHST